MTNYNVAPDFTEMLNGTFRAIIKLPEKRLQKATTSIPIQFSPPGLYKLKSVEISNGWDIEYVQIANIMLTAFRISPWPLCTPAMRITILASPYSFPKGKNRVDAIEDALLTVKGELTT